MYRVAILRCEKLPNFVTWEVPNLEELFSEDLLLVREFQNQGIEAQSLIWSQPDVDWNQFDVALIRSTCDYIDKPEQFLHVLATIDHSSCTLLNSLASVRWNIDKHYLFDLANWGVLIVPTYPVSPATGKQLQQIFLDQGVHTVILKPTLGLGASYSYRIPVDELVRTLERLHATYPHLSYLAQPFIESIVHEGEWSFIYFNRQLSHVLLKKPARNDYRVQGVYGGTTHRVTATPQDQEQADAVHDALPFDLLYARLDFVRIGEHLAVVEVELIEPLLSFHVVPESIARLVHATRVRFMTDATS